MLAGILILVLLVGGLAYAIPWISSQRALDEADEPTERFSQSMRVLTRERIDENDPSAVSTPLTRAAELRSLSMTAKDAARRRRNVLLTLAGAAAVTGVLSGFSLIPWWSALIPMLLIVAFIVVARFSVVAMHRNLDERAADLDLGFRENEDTVIIDLSAQANESTEFSVDLSAPKTGVTWDPVPVTTPTYVSKPLMPRTVRTIDLSAPVVSTPLIPTADHPDDLIEEESVPLRRVVGE